MLIVADSAQNQETCAGLDQLGRNVNPKLLNNCARDSECIQMTCQAAGELRNYLALAKFILIKPCETRPGIMVELLLQNGDVVFDDLITMPVFITYNSPLGTLVISVSVESTSS